jgi:hypothetical protein
LPASEKSRLGSLRYDKEFDSTLTDAKILAQLARFHARRAIAAVHYNLFKRTLALPELLAATYTERDAVAAWRELVAAAGDRYAFDLAMGARNYSLCGHWRDELKKLEEDLKDLEAQCCPPDEAVAKAKTWQPANIGPGMLRIAHERVHTARPGEPVRIVVRAEAEPGIASVRLRYRHLTQFEDYQSLELRPTRTKEEFAGEIPGEFVDPKWDLMYFLEVTPIGRNGANWPNLELEAPYVVVKVNR